MSNTAETAFLQHVFQNQPWANIGDASGLLPSAAAGSFFIALHDADPGEAGTQTTSECAYTGYARVAVVRSAAGFTVVGDTVSNAATVQFAECTAGTTTARWFTLGTAASGAGSVLVRGQLSADRPISAGITPLFNPGQLSGVAV